MRATTIVSLVVSLVVGVSSGALGCRRDAKEAHASPPAASSPAIVAAPSAAALGSVGSNADDAVDAPRAARSFALTVASGNATPAGAPNVWAHVPLAYRPDAPLRLVFVFHGFENCLASFVAPEGVPCRNGAPARTSIDLEAQLAKSGSGAIAIVPQLAFDAKSGDPGVLGSGAALERLARDVIEGPLADALGHRKADEIERVAMIAISGGFQALYATLGAFGDRVRDVILLDAYYVEDGAVDAFFARHASDFARDAARPRHLAIVHSALVATSVPARGFARRAAATFAKLGRTEALLRRDVPADVTVAELATPVSVLFSAREHDEIPRADLWKALAAVR